MSSIGPKDYSSLLEKLSTALQSVNQAKGTTNDEVKKDKLDKAHEILTAVGEQLKTAEESVKDPKKILHVVETYNHVLRKFDEVNSYGASGEAIVRKGAPLRRAGEAIKLFFNKALTLIYGKNSVEGEAITKGTSLAEEAEERLEGLKKRYNALQEDLMRGVVIDENDIDRMIKELDTLKTSFTEFGVPSKRVIETLSGEEWEPDETFGSTSPSPSISGSQQIPETDWDEGFAPSPPSSPSPRGSQDKPEAPIVDTATPFGFLGKSAAGAGALRRKLVLDFAKMEALQGRLKALQKAAKTENIDEPPFEIVTEKSLTGVTTPIGIKDIERLGIKEIEDAYKAIRDFNKVGLPPERIARLELGLSLYRAEFNKRSTKTVGYGSGTFKSGQDLNQDYIDAAAASYFTFASQERIPATRFGRLVAHLMLKGDQENLPKLRMRLKGVTGPIPQQEVFTTGYLTLLNQRLKGMKNGSPQREGLIGQLVEGYATATVDEQTAIGGLLDTIDSLPSNSTPQVFFMRRASALQAPDGTFREGASTALQNMLSVDLKETRGLSEAEKTRLRTALVKAAQREFGTFTTDEEFRQFQLKLDPFTKKGGKELIGEIPYNNLVDAFQEGLRVHLKRQLVTQEGGLEALQQARLFSQYLPRLDVALPLPLLEALDRKGEEVKNRPVLLASALADVAALKTLFGSSVGLTQLESKLAQYKLEADQKALEAYTWSGLEMIKSNLARNVTETARNVSRSVEAAIIRGSPEELYQIESDLEKLRVDPDLAKQRPDIKVILKRLQQGIRNNQTLSFNRMQKMIEEKVPAIPPSGKKPWVREDLRTYLTLVKAGLPGEGLEKDAREEIVTALNSGTLLKGDSFAVKELIKFIHAAKQADPPRDLMVARGYALLNAINQEPRVGKRLYQSYKNELVVDWENREGFKPTPEQKSLLEVWNPSVIQRVAFTPIEHLHQQYGVLDRLRTQAQGNEELMKITDLLYKEIANYERFHRVVEVIKGKVVPRMEREKIINPIPAILIGQFEKAYQSHLDSMQKMLGNGDLSSQEFVDKFQQFLENGDFEKSYQLFTNLGTQIVESLPSFNKEFGATEMEGVTAEWGSVGSNLRDQLNDLSNHYGLLTNTVKELAWIHIEKNDADKKAVKEALGNAVGTVRDKLKNSELRRILSRDANSDPILGRYAKVVQMIDETVQQGRGG